MTVKEYNSIWYPLINNSKVFLGALEHNIQKAESPEQALSNLRLLGWGPELKQFLNDTILAYQEVLRNQIEVKPTTADVAEVRHGYWIPVSTDGTFVCCSNCGRVVHMASRDKFKGCPYCLALMDLKGCEE